MIIKNTLRHLLRHKLYSSINIIGFAIGIAVFFVIVGYVNHQLSFDKFHLKHNQTYKVYIGGGQMLPPAASNFLKDNLVAIEDIVRLDDWYAGRSATFIVDAESELEIDNLIHVDSSFFNLFDFKMIYGESGDALNNPNSIILSETYAIKLFGKGNPVGKSIAYYKSNRNNRKTYTIAGVIEDAPLNSSIQYNALISMSTIPSNGIRRGNNMDADWSNFAFNTYVKVVDTEVIEKLNSEPPEFWARFIANRWGAEPGSKQAQHYSLYFVPLKDVHFHKNNKRSFIYLILLIGLVILAVAIFNYVNLSLVISTNRSKEIGIRKVIGSKISGLFRQFVGESVIVTFISALLAILLIYIAQPLLFKVTGLDSLIAQGSGVLTILLFVSAILIIGILSGIYPAYFLAKRKPISILKNKIAKGNNSGSLKKVLVVSQFVISIFLVIGVLSVSKQVRYMRSANPGFDKEHIIYFTGSSIDKKYDVFKETLLGNPNIRSISRTNQPFGCPLFMGSRYKLNGEYIRYTGTTVDPSFVETFGIELAEGRNFSWENKVDFNKTALVNESFVEQMEIEHLIGKVVNFRNNDVKIIGVVKDFHNNSFHHAVKPSLFWYGDMNVVVHVKISSEDIAGTIANIGESWNKFSPNVQFNYKFLDETFDKLYKSDMEFSSLIKGFSILAVFIACMGLFGLISFTANQRKKEIGIRKINGAKIFEIVAMLNQDITKWIFISFILASPPAFFATKKWLENYAYKTELSWWIFALAGLLTLGIALITVSWQSWRAASRNPVESLRYE